MTISRHWNRRRLALAAVALLAGLAALATIANSLADGGSDLTSPPGNVTSVNLTRADGTVTASWDAPSGATKYHVTYNDGSGWQAPVPDHRNVQTTSISFSVDNAKTVVVGVRAGNAHGWSGWVNSPASGPYTPPDSPPANPPGSVSSVSITRADGSATASWDAPDGATKYHVTYNDGSGWQAPVPDHRNVQTTSISFSVDNAKTVVVGVRAGNEHGWSGWVNSAASGPYTPPATTPVPPSAPTGLTAIAGDQSVRLAWDDPSDSSITGYEYALQQAGSGRGAWTSVPASDATTTAYLVAGLTNGAAYTIYLRAANAHGGGAETQASATPNLPGIIVQDASGNALSALSVPEGGQVSYQVKLALQPTQDVEVCIGLSVRDNDDADITFQGEAADVVSLKLTFTPGNWDTAQTVTLVAAEDNDYADGARDLTHDAREYYSGKVDFTATEIDNDELSLTATRADDGLSASVSWSAYIGDGFQYYRVIVCNDSQYNGASCSGTVWTSAPIWSADSTGPVTAPGLDAGTGYGIILQIWRNGGALKLHDTLPALTAPAAPTGLSVTPGDGYLDIFWDTLTVSGVTGYDIRARTAGSSSWHDVASNVSGASHRYTTSETIDEVGVRARIGAVRGPWTDLARMPATDWLNTVQSSGGASIASAQSQSQLAAPTFGTITRDNARDEKLHVSWAAVTGASGYNLVCSDVDGWSWWQCGNTTSATNLTVDDGPRGDLHSARKYMVAVRAVTSDPADASDWKRSENIYPAFAELRNLTHSRSGGSVTLSWKPNFYTTGYEIDCAVSGSSYTRCATMSDQDDTAAQHSITISSWTVGGTTYNVDDGAAYNIKITSTNQWGKSATAMRAPLIDLIPNVSNLGEASDTFGQNVNANNSVATGFRTGTNSGGYTLQGVTLGFLAPSQATEAPLSVAIHAASSDNPAATATYTLTHVNGNAAAAGNATYACSGTCHLSDNTPYFLVLSSTSGPAYKWDTTDGDDETNTAHFGWSIDNGLKQLARGSWADRSWTGRFRVSATLAPYLSASNVAATTATLTIANHAGDWYYKHTNTGATCDGPVSGTTKNLTGLTAGTSYTYSAYSDSGCTSGNLLASASEFTTLAIVSVSTLSGGDNGVVNVGGGSPTQRVAQAFTTGSNTGGYTLSSIAIAFRATVGSPTDLEVTLHAASGLNPNTGTTLATLSGSSPSTAGSYTYTCSSGCDLSASTTYFVYIKAPNSASGSHYLATFTSSAATLTPSGNGWSIADKGRLQYVGVGWFESGSHYRIAVTATTK